MTDLERREIILKHLNQNYSVKVSELSKLLFIGEATIRRDLKKLENGGYLRRVYGGAVRRDTVDRELPIEIRQTDNLSAKQIICTLASQLLNNGDVISLDSSTTVQCISEELSKFSNLTILTQGQRLIERIQFLPLNIYCSGGLLQQTTRSYNGTFARSFFSSFHADIAFISCKAISMGHGLSWVYEEEACLRRTMLEHATKRVLLCDASKFDQVSTCQLFGFEYIDCLITDKRPSDRWLAFLEAQHVTVIYPDE